MYNTLMINLKRTFFIFIASISLNTAAQSTLTDVIEFTSKQSFDPNTEINKMYQGCPLVDVPSNELSSDCKKRTNPQIRKFFKSYFQNLSKAEKIDQRDRLTKMLGMMIKESSANPAAVSDMKGNGSSNSYKSFFRANASKGVMSSPHYANTTLLEKLINQKGVTINHQTNFGLGQLSADRLDMSKWGGSYLSQKAKDIKKMSANTFLKWCGTTSMYNDSKSTLENYFNRHIKNCSMSSKTESGIKCFARTINLCPRMTVELALRQPMRYFETRYAKPICSELFK
jgi:hypothetical protein